jgi:hypothetical protein
MVVGWLASHMAMSTASVAGQYLGLSVRRRRVHHLRSAALHRELRSAGNHPERRHRDADGVRGTHRGGVLDA